jgi:3-hydroxyacyl-[acyl-carrier-protein] dehydratase|tara:strand:- start:720 stop:1184 length:465 start_codon:yes stop_codon:yes gene_type:complete
MQLNNKGDILEIMNLLPHRYPFLLVDKISNFEDGKSILCIKNVSFNEPFFNGHFPKYPVMPGVLILEALAQASGLLVFKTPSLCPPNESLYLFVGIDKARFKKPVVPGDQIELKVEMSRSRQGFAVFDAVATVDGEVAATAELMCGFKELPENL